MVQPAWETGQYPQHGPPSAPPPQVRGPAPQGRRPMPGHRGPMPQGRGLLPDDRDPRPQGRGPMPQGRGPVPDDRAPMPPGRGPTPTGGQPIRYGPGDGSLPPGDTPPGRGGGRGARARARAQRREARWEQNRYAVPYRTDGPRVTFGAIWFALLVASAFTSPIAVAGLASLVAGLAALQCTYAWFPDLPAARAWAAGAAFLGGLGGFLGGLGVVAGLGIAVALCLAFGAAFPTRYPTGDVIGGMIRAAVPPALAAGSMAALGELQVGALLALIVLVSAYEVGDFLVGSGSFNAVEGPVSGIVALGSVVFILWILVPAPFTQQGMLLFGILTALSCPLGQLLASALLPRGAAWAPALRRLDSYLVVAPLWMLLLTITPVAETV